MSLFQIILFFHSPITFLLVISAHWMTQGYLWNPFLFLLNDHDIFQYAMELLIKLKYAVWSGTSLNIDEKSIIMHLCEVRFFNNSESWNQIPLKHSTALLLKGNRAFSHIHCLKLNEKACEWLTSWWCLSSHGRIFFYQSSYLETLNCFAESLKIPWLNFCSVINPKCKNFKYQL